MVKVAINGFGRIGRLAFRQMFKAPGYEVVAINDLTSPAMLAHLLKYDTAQGPYCGKLGEKLHTVESTADSIIVDGKEIKIYAIKDAKDCPWGKLDIDVVLECTGFYASEEEEPGAHRRRRQEGHHLRARRQDEDHRVLRERKDPQQER